MQKPKSSRKPFVAPALKEEASLEDVTLISGGVSSYSGGKNKGKGHGGHGGHSNRNNPKNNGPRKH